MNGGASHVYPEQHCSRIKYFGFWLWSWFSVPKAFGVYQVIQVTGESSFIMKQVVEGASG